MNIKTVTAKLAGMRKPQRFVVYPFKPTESTLITVQSERAIGRFDPTTGQGVLNWRGSGYKVFAHLNTFLGAESYQFPMEFVNECIAAQPLPGDTIANGVVTII